MSVDVGTLKGEDQGAERGWRREEAGEGEGPLSEGDD